MGEEARRYPRAVPLEPRFAALLPELVLGITPEQLAVIAARALHARRRRRRSASTTCTRPTVSVREQAALIVDRLRRTRSASFRVLIADCRRDDRHRRPVPGRCSSSSGRARSPSTRRAARRTSRCAGRARTTASVEVDDEFDAERPGEEASERRRRMSPTTHDDPTSGSTEPARARRRVAWIVDALPAGAAGALEAVLMVVEEPVDEVLAGVGARRHASTG